MPGTILHAPVELTGVAPIDALSGTLIPGLVATYFTMIAALIWVDGKQTTRSRPRAGE